MEREGFLKIARRVMPRRQVEVTAEVRKTFIDRWVETSNMIEMFRAMDMDMPTNPSSILCSPKWCSFWTYCPMGEGLDKIGKT